MSLTSYMKKLGINGLTTTISKTPYTYRGYTLDLDVRVVCISNIIQCYGVSEIAKDLEINKHYTVTDIWEHGIKRGQISDPELFLINGEYYPSKMFKLLNEVRNDKIDEIINK